jgi:hypothetical protein
MESWKFLAVKWFYRRRSDAAKRADGCCELDHHWHDMLTHRDPVPVASVLCS